MSEESLGYRTIKNSIYNFAGFLTPIFVSIVVTAVVVKKIGTVDFGVYVLANSIGAFLGLADLGLSTALIKYVSEYQAVKDQKSLRKLLNSANLLYLAIAIVGFIIFFVLGKWFLPNFHIGDTSRQHVLIIFLLSGATFAVGMVNAVYAALPVALQRFDITNKINIAQLLLTNALILMVVLLGYKVKAIMTVTLFCSILGAFAFKWYSKKILPEIQITYIWDKEEIKKAYRFGVLASVTSISSHFLAYVDRMIIPMFLGPAQLAFYNLPGNVAHKTSALSYSLTSMVFPITSSLSGLGDKEKIKTIYVRMFRTITVVAAGITSSIILFAYPILFFWLGKEFADKGAGVLVILALTNFFLALYSPLQGFILGLGRVKLLLYSSVAVALINLLLLLIWVPHYGIMGAAWSYLVAVIPIIGLLWYVERRFLGLFDQWRMYGTLYAKLLFTAIIHVAIVKFVILKLVLNLPLLVLLGPLSVLLYYGIYMFLGFVEAEDLVTLKSFLSKFVLKRK